MENKEAPKAITVQFALKLYDEISKLPPCEEDHGNRACPTSRNIVLILTAALEAFHEGESKREERDAVKKERERCALIAEQSGVPDLAKEIRKGPPMKILLGPGAHESMKDLSPEDRAAIMREFIQAVQDGTIEEKSEKLDMEKLQVDDPALYKKLTELDDIDSQEDKN
jgi:hypothetical protein